MVIGFVNKLPRAAMEKPSFRFALLLSTIMGLADCFGNDACPGTSGGRSCGGFSAALCGGGGRDIHG